MNIDFNSIKGLRAPPHLRNLPRNMGPDMYMGPTWKGTFHARKEIWDAKADLNSYPVQSYESKKIAYLLDARIKHPSYPWSPEHQHFAKEIVSTILEQHDIRSQVLLLSFNDQHWKIGPKPEDFNPRPVSPLNFNANVPTTPPSESMYHIPPPPWILEEFRAEGREWDWAQHCWVRVQRDDDNNNPTGVPIDGSNGPGSPGSPGSPNSPGNNSGSQGNTGGGDGSVSLTISDFQPYLLDLHSFYIDNGLSLLPSLIFIVYKFYKEYGLILSIKN